MWLLVGLGIIVLLGIPFFVSLSRSTELFVLKVTNGEVFVVRGRLPDRLLEDIRDVLQRAAPKRVEVKSVVSQGKPRVVATGDLDEGDLQRLRNLIGRYEVAQIRSARKKARTRARRA